MKLFRFAAIATLLVLASYPALAADRTFDLTGMVSWVDPNSSGTFNAADPNQPFDISFNSKMGYGIAANIFFGGHFSTEFAASEVRPDAVFRSRAAAPTNGNLGTVKMIPITGVLQWHFAPNGRIDPYIGAGAAYVLFDNLDNIHDVGNLGVRNINFKDDAGLCLNAGIGFALAKNFALVADGKYVPVKSSADAVFATGPNQSQKVKINPVIFSAGLSIRF
jgi:outer membrane protein